MEFPVLDRLRRDLKSLISFQVESLVAYYDAEVHGFSHLTPVTGGRLAKFSLASSSTCVASLVSTGKWTAFEKRVAEDSGTQGGFIELIGFLDQMLAKKPVKIASADLPAGNAFTVAFALESVKVAAQVLKDLSPSSYDSREKKIHRWIKDSSSILIKNLRSTPPVKKGVGSDDDLAQLGGAHINGFRPSTFLTQLVTRALRRSPDPTISLPKYANPTPDTVDWAWRQILHESALLATGKRGSDPLSLVYALITYVSCKGKANLSLDEARIVSEGLSAFFGAQLDDGGWQQSRPLHFYPAVGNAYCFDFEVLAQLLECEDLKEHLLSYLPQLDKAFRYAQAYAMTLGEHGRCWSSGHHPHLPQAESWSTASVYQFLHNLDRLVAEAIRRHVFEYVGSPYAPPKNTAMDPKSGAANFRNEFLDSNIKLDGIRGSLTKAILENFLVPISKDTPNVAMGNGMKKTTAISGILYGPPGTSKTQLARLIAEYLRWPLLSIDPSHLVREGLDLVQAESNNVFSMLAALEQTVVFLDEFDELMRERTSSRADIMSRFLTTAMLPKLTSISDSRRVVFLLATNHVSQFDFAIRRPGRFDMVLQVMPPTWKAKQKNKSWAPSVALIVRTIGKRDTGIDKSWKDILDALTFLEFKSLCAHLDNTMRDEAIAAAVLGAYKKCTLNQLLSSGLKQKKTWRDQCTEDENLNRFL